MPNVPTRVGYVVNTNANSYHGGLQSGGRASDVAVADIHGDRLSPVVNNKIDLMIPQTRGFSFMISPAGQQAMGGRGIVGGRSTVKQPMWTNWQEYPRRRRVTFSAGASATAETLYLSDASSLPPDMVLMNVLETNEQILMTSRSGNTLTVKRRRGQNGVGRAIVSGYHAAVLNQQGEEGADPVGGIVRQPTSLVQCIGSFRIRAGITDYARAAAYFGISEEDRITAQVLREYLADKEWNYVFSQAGRHLDDTSRLQQYTTMGLREATSLHNRQTIFGKPTVYSLERAFAKIAENSKSANFMGTCSQQAVFEFSHLPRGAGIVQTIDAAADTLKLGLKRMELGGVVVILFPNLALGKMGIHNELHLTSDGAVREVTHIPRHVEMDIQTNGSGRKEWLVAEESGLDWSDTQGIGCVVWSA